MKEANKSLWRESKYCLESCRRAVSLFMAQIPVKGKGQKDGGRRKGKAEGKEGKRDYAKQVVKFPGENLFPLHQNTSDKRHPERE